MKRIGLAIILAVLPVSLIGHDSGTASKCEQLEGNWSVYCPKKSKKEDCKIDEDAELEIEIKQSHQSATTDFTVRLHGSNWKVKDDAVVTCNDEDPILAVPVENDGVSKLLCVGRITNIFDLAKRKGQIYPNPRQVGMRMIDKEEKNKEKYTCSWDRIDPGHSHADD